MDKDTRPFKIDRPEGLADYIKRNCQNQDYLIFSKKLNRCACTRCGEEMPLDDLPPLVHSTKDVGIICPKCGASVIPKNDRYGRMTLKDQGRIIWTKADGRDTYIEVDEFIIDYTTVHPGILIAPVSQILINADKQIRMDVDYFDHWFPVKTVKLCGRPNSYGVSKYHDHFYWTEEGLRNPEETRIEVGTDLKYANLSMERFRPKWFDENTQVGMVIRYMADFAKYPATEILEKSGFEKIVLDRASGRLSNNINMRRKDLRKILKADGAEIRRLREVNPSIGFLDDMKRVREQAPWAKVSDVRELSQIINRYMAIERLEQIQVHVDMSKILRRLLDENRRTGQKNYISDYSDYLSAVLRLGWNLDKQTLYPKDFRSAHDFALSEAARLKDEIDQANFERFQTEITGMKEPYQRGDYLIRPAKNPEELREESRVLKHCVRNYVDRVCNGQTSILFIRKVKDPDAPLFTLELSPGGTIVQCRGMKNCSYPDDVQKFIDEWQVWRKRNKNKAGKTAA